MRLKCFRQKVTVTAETQTTCLTLTTPEIRTNDKNTHLHHQRGDEIVRHTALQIPSIPHKQKKVAVLRNCPPGHRQGEPDHLQGGFVRRTGRQSPAGQTAGEKDTEPERIATMNNDPSPIPNPDEELDKHIRGGK